jgi:hypothetical protein
MVDVMPDRAFSNLTPKPVREDIPIPEPPGEVLVKIAVLRHLPFRPESD